MHTFYYGNYSLLKTSIFIHSPPQWSSLFNKSLEGRGVAHSNFANKFSSLWSSYYITVFFNVFKIVKCLHCFVLYLSVVVISQLLLLLNHLHTIQLLSPNEDFHHTHKYPLKLPPYSQNQYIHEWGSWKRRSQSGTAVFIHLFIHSTHTH